VNAGQAFEKTIAVNRRPTLDGRSLANTIDLARHDFSLLLVDPKPKMADWVESFKKKTRRERYRLY